MKYGKRLRDEVEKALPGWRSEFISYKKLKQELNLINLRPRENKRWRFGTRIFGGEYVKVMRENFGFTQLLDSEIDKVNTFYFDKEEDYVIRLKELQMSVANLDCNEEKLLVQKDILDFHAEMVSLLNYSVLNFTGLIKIVKKHNKKTSIQFSFMPRVLQQPFFSTNLLYELMMECEVMLRSLFLA